MTSNLAYVYDEDLLDQPPSEPLQAETCLALLDQSATLAANGSLTDADDDLYCNLYLIPA